MTIEEKARAYDEALERAKKSLRAANETGKDVVEYIFPCLVEDEDEKMRKALISYFENRLENRAGALINPEMWEGLKVRDILDYLNRLKKEEEPTDTASDRLDFLLSLKNCLKADTGLPDKEVNGFVNTFGDGLFDVAVGRIASGLDPEDLKQYKHELWMNYKGAHIKALEDARHEGYDKGLEDGKVLGKPDITPEELTALKTASEEMCGYNTFDVPRYPKLTPLYKKLKGEQ